MSEDPFIWLEDLNDPRTKKFIEEHNRKFREFVGDLPDRYRDKVRKYYEIPYIMSFEPTDKGFYMLVRETGVYKIKLLEWSGEVEEIVSSKELGEHVVISTIHASRDGGKLGFFYTEAGSDEGVFKVIDYESRKVIDEIRGCVGNIVWVDDTRYYYVRFYRRGETPDGVRAPAERIFLRDLRSGSEEIVFGKEYGTNYMMWIEETCDPDRIFVVVEYGWNKSIVYGGLRKDPSTWRLIIDGGEYRVQPIGYHEDKAYLIYYDGGGLGRIIRVSNGSIEEVVGEDKYPLNTAVLVDNKIYAVYLVDASSRLRIYSLDGKLITEHKFSEPSSIKIIRFFNGKVYFTVESFSKPPSLNMIDGRKVKEIHGYKTGLKLIVEEEWTTSSDGTRVHMFIIRNMLKQTNKAIVYGYGGFGIPITPFFLSAIATFVENGGVFVVANLRGGGEYGEKWHKMGMRENKQNVFEDYKAVLKHARRKGLRTIGWGISNGGLLVATTMVQAPELFDVALIGYPVIDMLRFHKLYIGRLWTTEYGDPDNPKDREYLLKYSPYHNVRKGVYPPALVYTGLHDDRVHPGHALKFVAKLEELGAPVFLRVETVSGHTGSSPEVKIKEYCDLLAFIDKALRELKTS